MLKAMITVLALVFPGAVYAQTCDYILVSTTDYSTGSTTSLDVNSYSPTLNVESICPDAVLRDGLDDRIYVVNRSCDNIQILDPCNGFHTVDQFSTGNSSNPHDILFYSNTKAYVTRYDMTSVLVMNPQNGATITTIDLAAFADADGIPEMDQMLVAGYPDVYLFVLLQRLDRNNIYTPVGTSYMVAIDMATDTVVDMDPGVAGVQPVTLARTNNYSEVNTRLAGPVSQAYFSCTGFLGVLDGAVVGVDMSDVSSQSIILTEAAAGGDILDVEIASDTRGYAIVATPSFTTELIAFNPATGAKIGSTLYAPGGYDLNDCEADGLGGVLLLTDRTPTAPGIRRYDIATGAAQSGLIDVGLPPFDILVNHGLPVGVANTPTLTALGSNYPNPFNPSTTIPFTLAHDGLVTLRVYDVHGKQVATLVDGVLSAGAHEFRWDGRNHGGVSAPSGVYFARLVAGNVEATRKMVLLK